MLHNQHLTKNPGEQFQDIEGKINSGTNSEQLANIIAKYREEMMDVFKTNEAEGNNDEKDLKALKDRLEWKQMLLKNDLGKTPPSIIDLSTDTALADFWKSVVDGSNPKLSGTEADKTEETDLQNKIKNTLEQIQFLHDDGSGIQERSWKLLGGKSGNLLDIKKNINGNTLIQTLLNETDAKKVDKEVEQFVKSVSHTKNNAFYISSIKLNDIDERQVAIRITLYLYYIEKLITDGKLTKDLYKDFKDALDKQIINEEIPKIKGLHNTKVELEYITPEYETLKDLNTKAGDKDLGNKDISTAPTADSIDLKSEFENGIATELETYRISPSTATDGSGNNFNLCFKDSAGLISDFSVNLGNVRKDSNIYININGCDVKIGTLLLENEATKAGITIQLDDINTITAAATAAGVTLPTLPLDLNISVKGIKNVNNKLKGCKASLTKNIKLQLTTSGNPVPPVPPVPPTPINNNLDIDAVISDMGTDVIKEKVAHNVEEELRKEYKDIKTLNFIKRARFFFARGKIRNNRIEKEMNKINGKVFTGDAAIDDQTQNASDRHQLEMNKGIDQDIENINTTTPVIFSDIKVNQLCKDYLQGTIGDSVFQTEFNKIIDGNTSLKDELKKANINHMGTNLLLQMKQKKEYKNLISCVKTNISNYGNNATAKSNIDTAFQNYIKLYQDNKNTLITNFNDYLGGRLTLQAFENYLTTEKARFDLISTNLNVKLNIIKGGKSAYQTNNKEREQSWKYKLGNWMDKNPGLTLAGSVGASILLGVATGGLGTVAGSIISTAGFSGMVGTTNAVKKWTHHTKEQNTHEKDLVTNHAETEKRIQERQNTVANKKGRKKYKAKRQLALYHNTTQSDINMTNTITNDILSIASNISTLSPAIENQLRYELMDGWARLKYYKEIGHNFLASDLKDKTEEDMNRLEKAILVGIQKLGDTNFIDTEAYTATNSIGQAVNFNDLYDKLKDNYEDSDKAFRKERKKLSVKYGVGTALLSAGASVGMQWITNSGMFAGKGTEAIAGYNSTKEVTQSFDLGKHNLLDSSTGSEIYRGTKEAISGAPSGSSLNIHYGAGTDATAFLPGRTPTAANLATKVAEVSDNINGMSGLTAADKATFIKEVANLGGGTGTNGVLQNMRQAEFLEHAAQALSDSGQSGNLTLSLIHDSGLDVVGTHTHDATERVVNGFIEVLKEGRPGTEPKTRGRWLMGMPTFWNTFKDENEQP